MNDFLKHATDIHQYDSEEVDWKTAGSKDTPSRQFFQEYLKKVLNVKGKSVLDIGSGIGQLFDMLKELGVSSVEGVEPSLKNVETSKKLYPTVEVFHGTLEQVEKSRLFDTAIAVMVFEHIIDLPSAFKSCGKNSLRSCAGMNCRQIGYTV